MRGAFIHLTCASRLSVFARPSTSTGLFLSSRKQHASSDSKDDIVFEDITKRIEKYKQQLKRSGALANLKSRHLSTSISNLAQSMASVKKKRDAAASSALNAVANIPAFVSIEILSNGTTHLHPCVVLRTPLKTYLFNCPEGTTRFLPVLRLKPLNVHDIFITRAIWDNIGGISSILLSKDATAAPMRIHGTMNVKHFLECIRPFQDSDYGSVKYPSQIDECAWHDGGYEDAGLRVTYIPLSVPLQSNERKENNTVTSVDIAYLTELKAPARRIDFKKLLELQIPKGPIIGRLKAGESVQLPDGRNINPEQVYLPTENQLGELQTLLVADCADFARLEALMESSVLKPFLDGVKRLDYFVHLSSPGIISSEAYKKFVSRLGDGCTHIGLNGSGPVVPHVEGIYRNHRLLRSLLPSVFPELKPVNWIGTVAQNSELCERNDCFINAAPLQKFPMRIGGSDDPITIDLRDGMSDEERIVFADRTPEEKAALEQGIAELQRESSKALSAPCEYPCISFLGTSSAVPSKYRNVSGYLIETNQSSCFMVDVGEGSYGQIRVLYGDVKTSKLMIGLRAIFVTHAHQDHMNGLYTMIEKRRNAFDNANIPYVPLVLVCNKNVVKPFKTYSQCFDDLESLVRIVDLCTISTAPANARSPTRRHDAAREQSPTPLTATRDMTPLLPSDLFDAPIWGLDNVTAVQVHHTRMANGFVFMCAGKKLVFSGDTKPCALLVSEGQDADLLVHEATFEDGCEIDAERKKHSTMGQAVKIGKEMRAKNVILTHFSARYHKVPALPAYLDAAGNVAVATDNMRARCDHWHLLPKLVPLFRHIYQDELFSIELRKDQRNMREKEGVLNGGAPVQGGKKQSAPSNFEVAKKRRREQEPWIKGTKKDDTTEN